MKKYLVLAFTGACGGDLATPDAGASDAAVVVDALETCDLTKPFGPPVEVKNVNTVGTERNGWMSADGLTIYLGASLYGAVDRNIYVATRTSTSEDFATPTQLDGVNTMYSEDRPTLTADGLEMFMEVGDVEVHHSTRTTTSEPFSAHTAVINDGGVDRQPWIATDGLTLYFSSNRPGVYGINPDLYRATRPTRSSPFAAPVALDELNTNTDEVAPVLSGDGLEIFFGKYLGFGNIGVYHATRAVPSGPFGEAQPLTELGVDGENTPSWVSANRCRLIYTRTLNIWMATRPE